jgi:hypothetical protein
MEKARRTEKMPLTQEFLDMDTDEEDFDRQGFFSILRFLHILLTILKRIR